MEVLNVQTCSLGLEVFKELTAVIGAHVLNGRGEDGSSHRKESSRGRAGAAIRGPGKGEAAIEVFKGNGRAAVSVRL